MKIGKNIKSAREAAGKTPEIVAKEIGMDIALYLDIENDLVDITLNQLELISAAVFSKPADLIEGEFTIGQIRNYFYNQQGNSGININVQGINQEEIRKGYKELYAEELNRIPKLEKLLRSNNIEFDF